MARTPFKFKFGWLVLRNIIFRQLEYRAQYYLLIASVFISFAADYLILKYSAQNGRQSYIAVKDVLSFVIIGLFIRSSSAIWDGAFAFEREIRNGDFRRYLLQPVRFSQLFISSLLGEKLLTWIINVLLYIGAFYFVKSEVVVIPHWSFFIFLPLSLALTWGLYFTIVLTTFWLHEASFMIVAFNLCLGIFSGTLVPSDWLPRGLQTVIDYTPLKIIGDVPMKAAFSKIEGPDIYFYFWVALAWLLFIFTLNNILFYRGVRRYESFGG